MIRLGKVQMRIMQVLWHLENATAKEITELLNEWYPDDPIAHSTVQTLLRGLLDKQTVRYENAGRTFVFQATVSENQVKLDAARDLMSHLFDGNVASLVSFLLEHEKISDSELVKIKKLMSGRTRESK